MSGRGRAISAWLATALVLVLATSLVGVVRSESTAATGATCLPSTSAADLSTLLARQPGGMFAADYQRPIPLPDGRTLWLFQDASLIIPSLADGPPTESTQLIHNAALLQTGTCFELLRTGTDEDPHDWLFASSTIPFGHWFWPLDATMGDDGRLYVFVAEMREWGPLYLSVAEPLSTRVVAVDLATMKPVWSGYPADAGRSLYGFSITSDEAWTYLYAQCHRQFGWDPNPLPAHDLSCSARVTVARVPKGRPLDALSYWDGAEWQPDPARAVSVIPQGRRTVNPTQVRWTGTEFVAVTKVGDWFGTTIFFDHASSAEGPWVTYARIRARPKCKAATCNTYFASWIPSTVTGDHWMIGLSHNRWDGVVSEVNRPSFLSAPHPGGLSFASRCRHILC